MFRAVTRSSKQDDQERLDMMLEVEKKDLI
jgi:hypothetical protein